MDCYREGNGPGEPGAHRLQVLYMVCIYAYMFIFN